MELPKVNILTAGTFSVAILSAAGGSIWYASNQASIIEGLQSDLETLTIENNATDRTNLIRDVEENSEQIAEIIEYIIELEESDSENTDEIYTTFDEFEEQIYEDLDGVLLQFNQIVKLQARVKTLENTLEFLARRSSLSDGR
jgi:mevalonate kinase